MELHSFGIYNPFGISGAQEGWQQKDESYGAFFTLEYYGFVWLTQKES